MTDVLLVKPSPSPTLWGRGGAAWYGVLVLIGVLTVALLSKWSARGGAAAGASGARFAPKFARDVKALLTVAARWSAAAAQDSSPMLKVLDATYAVAYVNAARSLADDKELERVSGVRVPELQSQVQAAQTAAIQAVAKLCPSVVPDGAQVLYTGWLG